MSKPLRGIALATSLLLAVPCVHATRYRCDLLPHRSTESNGWALNSAREVAGFDAGGVRWSATGQQTALRGVHPYEDSSHADGINNAGRAVGGSGPVGFPVVPTVWDGDVATALPLLPGGTAGNASALNDAGIVVGYSGFAGGGSAVHATLWSGAEPVDLGTLGPNNSQATRSSSARAINQAGEIVGLSSTGGDGLTHAVYWGPDRRIVDLGTLPGSAASAAARINNHGVIVGTSHFASEPTDPYRPVVWINRAIRELARPPGQHGGSASALNDAGAIVGTNLDRVHVDGAEFPFIGTALLWPGADDTPIDLNAVTGRCRGPRPPFYAERLVSGVDINADGVILVRFQGLKRSRGWYFRAALLTPVH